MTTKHNSHNQKNYKSAIFRILHEGNKAWGCFSVILLPWPLKPETYLPHKQLSSSKNLNYSVQKPINIYLYSFP